MLHTAERWEYEEGYYDGQTALHIAIEKRNFELVKLLIDNEADVNSKACGDFFQWNKKGSGCYFGEFPLSLAACTDQPNIVDYLLDEPKEPAKPDAKDRYGNTVLHALVLAANNTKENTEMITKMYDYILKKTRNRELEEKTNNDHLTPLTLAAKTGKTELLKHILRREILDEEYQHLSRKFTEWTYGPVHMSLYDLSSVDTSETHSVLETIVFKSNSSERHKMIALEPINQLLQDKWDMFASKIFYAKFILYLIYMIIFTVTASHRPRDGQFTLPSEGTTEVSLRVLGEIIVMFGNFYILTRQIIYFCKRRPTLEIIVMDGYFEVLFLLQALILLCSGVIYLARSDVYITFLVLALVIGWVDVLYYSLGFQLTGIYSVMMQKTIVKDMVRFLLVYLLFLSGFAAGLVTLVGNANLDAGNSTEAEKSEQIIYSGFYVTYLELFKFTIGMGTLEFEENFKYKHFLLFLLVLYVVLTYILLLNMLIALMSETVNDVAKDSMSIWKLQRAATILDIEKFFPWIFWKKCQSGEFITVGQLPDKKKDERLFFRVEEKVWDSWDQIPALHLEDPGGMKNAKAKKHTKGNMLMVLSDLLDSKSS